MTKILVKNPRPDILSSLNLRPQTICRSGLWLLGVGNSRPCRLCPPPKGNADVQRFFAF